MVLSVGKTAVAAVAAASAVALEADEGEWPPQQAMRTRLEAAGVGRGRPGIEGGEGGPCLIPQKILGDRSGPGT